MSERILFVDDDAALLKTMRRNLGFEFDVAIAEGGEEAVNLANAGEPFAVIVVDMQMPKMNGLKTIEALREISPDSVFVMLTGNQDQTTAIQALNEGQVFRFLTKPCQVSEITEAIEVSKQHYRLATAEKQLLHGTFSGTINLMTDLIELPGDRHLDTSRMVDAMTKLSEELNLELGWEERVAARVFLVGIAMLDSDEAAAFDNLDPATDEHRELFKKICIISASMISKIPRLGWIVDALKAVPKAETYSVSCDRKTVGAVLLKVIFYWNYLTCKGLSAENATTTIQKLMPELPGKVIDALALLNDNKDALLLSKVAVEKLRDGMIIHEDVIGPNGDRLVSAGRRLTHPIIDNLQRTPGMEGAVLEIVANSIPKDLQETALC